MSPPDPGDSGDRNSSDLAVKGSWKTRRLGHKTKIQQSGDKKTIFRRLGHKTKYHQRRR